MNLQILASMAAWLPQLLQWVAIGMAGALLVFLAIAVSNFLLFPRLKHQSHTRTAAPTDGQSISCSVPIVSVLIPARNEAAIIGGAVRRMLQQQNAPPFELLLLDDASTDGTAAIALAAGEGDPRLRLLTGAPLPPGWIGKSWACQQLADAAQAEWLLFTDADVLWEPDALAAVLAEAEASRADLLSIWPTQEMVTWSERVVVPLMSFALLAYLPVAWVHGSPWPQAAAANGQCMLFRRTAWLACGGHAKVRGSIIEDVSLARNIKACGRSLRLADGAGLVRARMYNDWQSVRDGFAKNILAGHLNSPLMLGASTLFHIGAFVGPWAWLLADLLFPQGPLFSQGPLWAWLPLLMLLLGYGARTITSATARQPLHDVIWMPVGVLLMTRIALQSLWWRARFGGVRWKGRTI